MKRTRWLDRKAVTSRSFRVVAELLEQRQLLSVSILPNPSAYPVDGAQPQAGFPTGSSSPSGYSPTAIKSAYGISGINFGGVTGTGAGQTIAIIVAHDNPNLVDSTSSSFNNSDLHNFDVAFGLPDPPSFKKLDEGGGTSYPSEDPGWANEAALDVEWTHAIAPQANIVLVEASSTNLSDLVQSAAVFAAGLPNVSAVTMSFAVNEFYGETSYDSYLGTPAGHSGVTFLAASGDNGNKGGYPAYSPNVLAVGGTTLSLSGNNYVSESGLNTSGGGISQYEPKPAYQFADTKSSTARTIPDVSIVGDKNTGVSVYDSTNGGAGTPWYKIGGTSASTPIWAGLVAITNQGRAQAGLANLDGPSQTLPRLYALNSSDYHDITTGSNGYSANAGYDLVTGIGTPIANKLVPDLAGGNKVSGTIFSDNNGNGVKDAGETGLSGYNTFIDLYNSGTEQGADPSTSSGFDGSYQYTDLPGGTYRLTQSIPAGVDLSTSSYQSVTLGYNSTLTGKDIGFKPTGAAAKLGFAQQPTTVIVGNVISPPIKVDVEDASGGTVATDNSPVTLSVAGGGGSLGGTLTVNAVNGVATFSNITVTSIGTETLLVTDGSLTSATSNSFQVTTVPPVIGTPTQLAFSQQPFGVTQGAVISPSITVQVLDAHGNVVTSDSTSVSLSIASGASGAALGGTLTVTAVNGIATFNDITVSQPGTYTLVATDGSLTSATSSSFTVAAIVYIPAKLVIAQQPVDSYVGSAITPPVTVNVEDANGVLVTANTSPVTLSIAAGPTGGTLGGTLTVNAVNGVATFTDLTVSEKGTYTLSASDGLLTPATFNSFNASIKGLISPSIIKSTVPISVVGGAGVRGSVVVDETNLAPTTATGLVTTNIYASSNGALVLLGTISKRMKVLVKKTFLITVPIKTIPASLNGNYSLVATVTDPTGNSSTSQSGGNVLVAPPFIALKPTIARLTLLPAVVGGSKTNSVAILKIVNTGNIPATGSTTVGIYASLDGSSTDATLITNVTRRLSIPVGRSVSISVPLKQIPSSLDGNYQILAQVTDPKSAVTTTASSMTVNFAPPFVAFTASAITVTPTVVSVGKSVSMTVTIQNTGNISTTGPATIVLGVSSDGISQLSELTTITRSVIIAPAKTTVLHLRFVEFVSVTPGSYFPFVTYTQDGVTITGAGISKFDIG